MNKVVNFVYSRNKLDFKKFTKASNFSDIVSYHDIITKLVKNDKSNDKPSEIVVNSYLRKKILKVMTDESSLNIVYALKDLDLDVMESIKDLMSEYWDYELSFNLIIIEHKKLEIDSDDKEEISNIPFINAIEYVTI